MAVSAIDEPATITVSEDGLPGDPGTNGTDGEGFNLVRRYLIDNPVSWLYAKNNLVRTLKNLLTVSRATSGAYTDIYGDSQIADDDTPREEVEGWFLNGDEIHTFQIVDNIPQINDDFSVLLSIGSYSETSASQDIISIPATSGDLFSIGSDSSGNILATLQGSDTAEYEATTAISATTTTDNNIIVTYTSSTGVMNIYINDSLEGTVTLPTFTTATMDLDESVLTVDGDFDINIKGLRFYDFVLNSEEITYLN